MTGQWQVILTDTADRDIDDIIAWSITRFGPAQARAYEELLAVALADLKVGPDVVGSIPRGEIAAGLRTRRISRQGRRASHFLVYRAIGPRLIEVVRILHDRMDVGRHLPSDPA